MPKRISTGLLAAGLLLGGGGVTYAHSAAGSQQQVSTCYGQVMDNNGEPLVGASVMVKGTNKGASADLDGKFQIAGVNKGAVIVVSYVGYTSQEQKWDGRELYFSLKEDSNSLDELVVVGYGVQKKANVTGAVSTVKADQIQDRAVASVSSALAGQMPGVVVVQQSGAPGSQTGSITVRGANSINAASPLVIVDGVPGSMNNIDPQDIESVTVLKDAASAAIYGVQAANGVILITTKRGRLNTAATVSYTGSVGWASPTTHLHKVNAMWHEILYREALLNVNPNSDVSAYDKRISEYQNGTRDAQGTDWFKETFKSASTETMHTVQLSGGSANTTYMASLGYVYQGGLLDQINYNRYNGRMNLDSKIKPWIAFGMQTSFYRGVKKDGYTGYDGIMQHMNRLNATMPAYTEDGGFAAPNGFQNPIAESDYRTGIYRSTMDQLFTNIYANITPIEGLSIKPLFSWRHDHTDIYRYRHILSYDGGYNNGDNGTRRGEHNYYDYDYYTYQLTANYNKTIAEKHSIGILAGYEAQKYTYHYTLASRQGGGDNLLDQVLNSLDENGMKNEDGGVGLNRRSWFGRLTYDFDSRYLFEANFRADASSRFPKNNRWGYFPAVSAAWRLSQESFMEGTHDWLDNLKIRVGWGRTGNEETDEYYPAVATYAFTPVYIGTDRYTAMYQARYVNPNLKWATVTNFEVGLESAFLNRRLIFEGSFYKRKTSDMLLNLPIQSVLGFSAPLQNAGSVENTGVDLSISHNNRVGDWTYNIGVNAGYNHNEITNLCGTEGPQPGNNKLWYIEGESIGSYYGYQVVGMFRTEEDLQKYPKRTSQDKLGNLRYLDWNGLDENGNETGKPDGKITPEDRKVIGKLNPTWMLGVNVDATWKWFDFSMLWQGAFDYNRYMEAEATQAFYNNGTAMEWMKDRWTPETPNGYYPRLYPNSSSSPDVNCVNSFWCEDASYFRLKNLTIGYTLPTALTEKIGFNKVRFFFTGENLLTFSKIFDKDIDPEAPAGRGGYYANVKKFSLGLKFNF